MKKARLKVYWTLWVVLTLGTTIRISILNLLDDTSSGTLSLDVDKQYSYSFWQKKRSCFPSFYDTNESQQSRIWSLHIKEESEHHGWNNLRWVMVISYGHFFYFGLIVEYMNWQPIVLFPYSLKFLFVLKSIYYNVLIVQ